MNDHLPLSLATRIQERMSALGLNPFSTAKKAGLGQDFVRDILRGKARNPSSERLAKLAEALEVSVPYLLGKPELEPAARGYGRDGEPLESVAALRSPGWEENQRRPRSVALPIRFELMTGAFRRSAEIQRDRGFESATIVEAYASREQWFEVVRDDGAALVAPMGALLQVAKFTDEDRAELGEGDVVIVERHHIGPNASSYLIERSVRIIHRRYPDLGLWFFEYATDDIDHWGQSDDIFRDEQNPEVVRSASEIEELLATFADDPPVPHPNSGVAPDELMETLRQLLKLRPRLVGKVLRALVPIDERAEFGLSPTPQSGRFGK